jgi:hypothetical protein
MVDEMFYFSRAGMFKSSTNTTKRFPKGGPYTFDRRFFMGANSLF